MQASGCFVCHDNPNPNPLVYIDMQENVGSLTVNTNFDVFRGMQDTRQKPVELFISQAHACTVFAVHLYMMNSHINKTHLLFHLALRLHPVLPLLHCLQLYLIIAFIITLIMISTRGKKVPCLES